MTVREYAEIFSDLIHCSECYMCKAQGVICQNCDRPKINIEPLKDYPFIYHKLKCQYNSYNKCNSCPLNKKGSCTSRTSEIFRIFDQEIGQFLQTATGEVEIYEQN